LYSASDTLCVFQVHEKSLEQQKKGPSSSSPSVSSNKSPLQLAAAIVQPQKPLESPQHMVTPVRLQESPGPRTIPCSSGSVGSGSGAAPFDICIKRDDKCSIKLSRSLLEINREKRREREQLSKEAAPLQYLRPGMVLLKKFLKHDDQVSQYQTCCSILLQFLPASTFVSKVLSIVVFHSFCSFCVGIWNHVHS
jgi:hypothetical protein